MDGRPVERDAELPSIISGVKPGKTVKLEVWRDRAVRNLNVAVVELKPEGQVASVEGSGEGASQADVLGLSIRPLAPEERSQVSTEGNLVVENVEGPALAAGVRPGDIILGVNGSRVRTADELAAASKRSGKTVALLVQRGEGQIFVPVRIP